MNAKPKNKSVKAPKYPTYCYPIKGGKGTVYQLANGAKMPKGFQDTPVAMKVVEIEDIPSFADREADIANLNEQVNDLQLVVDKADEDNTKLAQEYDAMKEQFETAREAHLEELGSHSITTAELKVATKEIGELTDKIVELEAKLATPKDPKPK